MASSQNEFDIPDDLFTKLLPKLRNNLGLPRAVEFVADTRLNDSDHECAGYQTLRLGMIGDKFPYNANPGRCDIGLPDADIKSELRKKFP